MNFNKSRYICRPSAIGNSNRDDNPQNTDAQHSSSPLSLSFDYHKRMDADADGRPRTSLHEPLVTRRKDHGTPPSFSTSSTPTSQPHEICDNVLFHSSSFCPGVGKTATEAVLRARGAFSAALYRVLSTILSVSIVILIMLTHFSVVTLALIRSHFKCRVSQKPCSRTSNGMDVQAERRTSEVCARRRTAVEDASFLHGSDHVVG